MATFSIKCGNCGEGVAAAIVAQHGGGVLWLLCPSCENGSVRVNSGAVWPVAPAGGSVASLPDDVAQAWREARSAHAVAAYTASEMMCRKILMHLAVDVAGSAPGGTFKGYIEHLDEAGYISTGLKPAIEQIKDRGNGANHQLPASTEAESLVTLQITEHLLRSTYEIPGLIS